MEQQFPQNILANLDGTNGFEFTDAGSTTTATSFSIDIGDMNGDGIPDFAFGNSYPTTISGSQYDGEVRIFFGQLSYPASISLSILNGTNGFRVVGLPKANLGQAVKFVDVNNDGYKDLMIGAAETSKLVSQYDTTGFVYVIYGHTSDYPLLFNVTALDGSNGFTIGGAGKNDNLGIALTTGDINGDGITDLIAGASGKVYTFYGQATPFPAFFNATELDGSNGFKLTSPGVTFGAVHTADIDQDGRTDLMACQGRTYVLFGRDTFPAEVKAETFDGTIGFSTTPLNGKGLLQSTLIAADINHDGYPDIAAGSPVNTVPGKIFLPFSHARPYPAIVNLSQLNGTTGFTVLGDRNDDYIGSALSTGTMGDMQIILTGSYPLNNFVGRVVGLYGSPLPFPSSISIANLDATGRGFVLAGSTPAQLVGATTAMGRINSDNYDDMIIRASNSVFIVYGTPYLFPTLTIDNTTARIYTENNPGLTLDSQLTLSSGTYPYLNRADVTINNVQAGDVLTMATQPNISANYDPVTGILSLSGTAPTSEYEAALRAIVFNNALQNSNTTPRQITFTGNNGVVSLVPVNLSINFITLNNLLSGKGKELICFNQNQNAALVAPQISILSANLLTLENATVTISNFIAEQDSLEFADLSNNVNGSFNNNTGTLMLTGPAPAHDFEAVLRTVKYKNNNTTNHAVKTFATVVNFEGQPSNALESRINLITVNDAPTVVNPLPDFNVTVNEPFSFRIANNTFSQPQDKLDLSLMQEDGASLPAWVSLNKTDKTLTGIAPSAGQNRYSLFARDICSQATEAKFGINALAANVPSSTPSEQIAVSPTGDSGLNVPALVGGLIGGLTLIGGGVFGLLMYLRKKKKDEKTREDRVNVVELDGQDTPINNNPAHNQKRSIHNMLYNGK